MSAMRTSGRSGDERYLMRFFQGCSASVFHGKVEKERRLQHQDDFQQKADRLAGLTIERMKDRNLKICRLAIGLSDQWERTCDSIECADRQCGAIAFLIAFMELPQAEQRKILGGWETRLELLPRTDHELYNSFENGSTIERILLITAGSEGRGDVEAVQCNVTNLCRSAGVRLRVSEGIPQEDVIRSLERMLQAVREQWPDMMRMEPDSVDAVKVEYRKSGLQAGDDSLKLGGTVGVEAGEEQTADVEEYDSLYA